MGSVVRFWIVFRELVGWGLFIVEGSQVNRHVLGIAFSVVVAVASVAQATVIYDTSVQTGFRYNAGQPGTNNVPPADNLRTPFDDVPFAGNFSTANITA